MSEKIQRVPTGVLSMLNIVGSGGNPRMLLDEVSPQIDFEKFYLTGQFENTGTTGTATNVGDGLLITVPAGEYWLVGGASFAVELAAGDNAGCFVGWRPDPSGSTIVGGTSPHTTGAVLAAQMSCRAFMPKLGILLAPGGVIRGQLTAAAAAARNCNLFAAIVRLRF